MHLMVVKGKVESRDLVGDSNSSGGAYLVGV